MRESADANHPGLRRVVDDARRPGDHHAFNRALEDFRHRLAQEVLAFAHWGLYEEDAWAFALTQADEAEDDALESSIRADILRKYPHSAAANALARAAREEQASGTDE
jgi:hypothetical protein